MRQLVEFLAKSLADEPAEVRVEEIPGEGVVTLAIRVAAGDAGKIIGRQGRVINAIRTLTKAHAARQGRRVRIEVVS